MYETIIIDAEPRPAYQGQLSLLSSGVLGKKERDTLGISEGDSMDFRHRELSIRTDMKDNTPWVDSCGRGHSRQLIAPLKSS